MDRLLKKRNYFFKCHSIDRTMYPSFCNSKENALKNRRNVHTYSKFNPKDTKKTTTFNDFSLCSELRNLKTHGKAIKS